MFGFAHFASFRVLRGPGLRGPGVRGLRALLALALALAAPSSALPLAVAPPSPGPAATPSCPAPSYANAGALLVALQGASYACAEQLAAALRPRAGLAEADALLLMARSGANALIRRNALRALGRLAEAPRGSRAHELVLRARAAALQATLAAILAGERDSLLTQDAVWIVDAFFYPSFGAAAGLERVAADTALAPALRYRAAAARARLIYARPGPLAASDHGFITTGLHSDDPGVRAAAAMAAARLRSPQLVPALRTELEAALGAAWAAEPPLALAPDAAAAPGAAPSLAESSPTSLTARAAIARARDRLAGSTANLDALRSAYEALALPATLAGDGATLRAGLPPGQLPALLALVAQVRAAFNTALGPPFAAAIPGEPTAPLSIIVFARQGVYRDYVRAFTPFTVDVDGTYDAATATLYTHARTAQQSENSLAETLRHELTHHLTAQQLFPGSWQSPGYHREPKGWLDEGLAEVMAGLAANDAPAPRPAQLARLCERQAPAALAPLLAMRAGYDSFGSFDYDAAWALNFYLLTERPAALRRIAAAYRNGTYRLENWPRLAGAPLAQLESEWHAAMSGWCGAVGAHASSFHSSIDS